MTDSTNQIKKLSITALFAEHHSYIIPIYQRNYAWTEKEVHQMIDDIHRHQGDNYYLGSLTVKKRDDAKFEVIDGQQRLTTLFLMLSVLGYELNLDLSFEHRTQSGDELSLAKKGEQIDSNSQIANIYNYLKSNKGLFENKQAENKESFLDKLLNKVQLIRIEIPENTDLNQYFERMNNRGEQLEHHEVIKAKLMSKLADDEKVAFAAIWNACSDMNRYAVTAFGTKEREKLFKHDNEYFWLYKDFAEFLKYFGVTDNESSKSWKLQCILQDSKQQATQNDNNKSKNTQDDDEPARFTSIIDFPNFLAQVLNLFLRNEKKVQDDEKIHRLDDKNLYEQFEQSQLLGNANDIKKFAVHLLNIRLLFDRHVIKFDERDDKNDWYMYQFKGYISEKGGKSQNFVNVFGKESDDKRIKMLQTMFHYSFTTRNYKYWLFAYLKWLNENRKKLNDTDEHIAFLELLCDKFYFNRFYNNGTGDGYFDIIYAADDKVKKIESNDFLNQGTQVHNFIFNRLDYMLWCKRNDWEWSDDKEFKSADNLEKFLNNFKFTARNSVEHYYPQNPLDGYAAPDNIDDFGNLCLITHSQNSSLSNKMPAEKKAGYDIKRYPSLSLKQREMLKYDANSWHENSIKTHGKEMIELLNQPLCATQSDA